MASKTDQPGIVPTAGSTEAKTFWQKDKVDNLTNLDIWRGIELGKELSEI